MAHDGESEGIWREADVGKAWRTARKAMGVQSVSA